jgi:hypothetical protein
LALKPFHLETDYPFPFPLSPFSRSNPIEGPQCQNKFGTKNQLYHSIFILELVLFTIHHSPLYMSTIPDFNSSELWMIRTTLKERYGQDIEIQLADSEVKLDPNQAELTWCPTVYWEVAPVAFVIFKTGLERYRGQFFYGENEFYGTGIDEYDNISDCVTTLLKMQADHESTQKTNSVTYRELK